MLLPLLSQNICLAIETQPRSLNTTAGSTARFVIITNPVCVNAKVGIQPPGQNESLPDKDPTSLENITIPEEFIGWRLKITYAIPNLVFGDNETQVYFAAFSTVGAGVLSDKALLLVEGDV